MMSSKLLLRRSVTRAAPRMWKAAFGTQTKAQVQAIEQLLENMHWADAKDEMKAIRAFMNENKTNHAIAIPDPAFEDNVNKSIADIQAKLNTEGHDEVFHLIHDLKTLVREELYKFV